MKAMYTAFAAMAVITVGSWFVLDEMGLYSGDQAAGQSVRLGDAAE